MPGRGTGCTGSYRLDRCCRFEEVDADAAALLGVGAGELIGRAMWDCFPALKGGELQQRFLGVLNGTGSQVFLYRFAPRTEWYAVVADPVGPPSLPVAGIAVRFAEVTDRVADHVRAERLDAAARATSQLAHAFNNSLTVLVGNAEYLEEELAGRPELAETARLMVDAGERTAALTRRVLLMNRHPRHAEAEADAARVLERVAARLRATADGRRIETAIQAGLPPVLVEAEDLEVALDELAANAIRALPGPGTIRLAAEAAPSGHELHLTVSDTGIGMDQGQLRHCLEPFVTSDRERWGAGLGLPAVHGFATAVGGALRIESAPGRGTQVQLALPSRPRAAAASAGLPRPPEGAEVLLVDDDPTTRASISRMLSSLGWPVAGAASAAEALSMLRGGSQPTILLSDVVLPGGLSGTALVEEVRRIRPGLPALLMSGYAAHAPEADRVAGTVRLLAKPFRKAELQRALLEAHGAGPPATT
ncbi:ATP-binding protein [Roseomonas sp. CCTCC AB2023176]|uniref:ATP-binding protein n=1 Tax=Roseomonas sp. CCTCC AB2023176 TaxID=3342640 RepID=UPI0035DB4D5F